VKRLEIRNFRAGDEAALHAVFHSAVHMTAIQSYTPLQIDAWAPHEIDMAAWSSCMQDLRPFVAEADGRIVGYADVQANGYMDHFFVAGPCARQGVGTALMNRILDAARQRAIGSLTSDVSRNAQPFFEKFGFVVVEQRMPTVRGVVVPNARMQKELTQ
jgi:putative acetyltransferase